MNKEPNSEEMPVELVAAALNEQGYLLHHKIVDVLQRQNEGKEKHHWFIDASEVPVSLPNGNETRIDLVLRNAGSGDNHRRVVMECKRAAREYKCWVFFGEVYSPRGPFSTYYYLERAELAGMEASHIPPPLSHTVANSTAAYNCPVFEYGVEVRKNRPDREKKSSATVAIEDAFQQVTLGQAGLALRLKAARETKFHLFPVVVTTAELMSAKYSVGHVSQDGGILEAKDLTLQPRDWLAVNFRLSDVTCQQSGLTTVQTNDLGADLAARQVRTVFVAQAAHIQEFLSWLEKYHGAYA